MPGKIPPPTIPVDLAHLRDFLRHTADPVAGCMEMRVFGARWDRNHVTYAEEYVRTIAGWFDREDSLAVAVQQLWRISGYVTVNPVNRAFLAVSDNTLKVVKAGDCTHDKDVTVIRHLYIDIDPKKPAPNISTTADELASAIAVRDRILSEHDAIRESAIWGCSGNGGWILVRVADLPNDGGDGLTETLLGSALSSLAHRYGHKKRPDDPVHIDPTTKNASRIMCLPGTAKCKGSHRPERPWRLVTIDSVGLPLRPPIDLQAWVADNPPPAASPEKRPAAIRMPRAVVPPPTVGGLVPAARMDDHEFLIHRARRCLSRMRPAISGSGGHNQTIGAAVTLINDFALDADDARKLLHEWNQTHCQPPWSDQELEHKLREAEKFHAKTPRGCLRDAADPADPDDPIRTRLATQVMPAGGFIAEDGTPIDGGANGHVPHDDPVALLFIPGRGPDDPHRIAHQFIREYHEHPITRTIRYWRDEYYHWDGRRYRPRTAAEMRAMLADFAEQLFNRLYAIELEDYRIREAEGRLPDGAKEPKARPVTVQLVSNVLQALSGLALLTVADCPIMPAWIAPGPSWAAEDVLPASNTLVHLPSLARGEPALSPPTPGYFCEYALDYPYDPDAPAPAEWLAFLGQLWPGDPESVATLQEWMGYLLTADTSQQKMLMMVGPTRCGKGTIARVIRALVGPSNVAHPTLASLGGSFGLQPLVGKTIAIIGDARATGRTDLAPVVEALLTISGEDAVEIHRKHKTPIEMKLPTRIMLISNELPRIKDVSGALVNRMVILQMTHSFLGHEDTGLFRRLLPELPGILLWSIAGWTRLRARGAFVQPAAGAAAMHQLDMLSSPIKSFLEDRCKVGIGETYRVPVQDLYFQWKMWCELHGRGDYVGDDESFGRDLRAVLPDLAKQRIRKGGERVAIYRGLRLRTGQDDIDEMNRDGLEVWEEETVSDNMGNENDDTLPF